MPISIPDSKDIYLSDNMISNWQFTVNTLASIFEVPAALIMRVDLTENEVYVSSQTEGNPYQVGDREHLEGLYCNYVMNEDEQLYVENALKSKRWMDNPDIELGMISYLGLSIKWPNNETFGTICVLDKKEFDLVEKYFDIIKNFKDLVENQLEIVYQNFIIEKQYNEMIMQK